MQAEAIIAVVELAKLGIMTYISYLRQVGLEEDQIDAVFQAARKTLDAQDPKNIPD